MADNRKDINAGLPDDEPAAGPGKDDRRKGKAPAPPSKTGAGNERTNNAAVKGAGNKNAGNKGASGKKKNRAVLKLVLILIPVFLVACFVVALIFNMFGFRDMIGRLVIEPLINTIIWFDPEFTSVDEALRRRDDERSRVLDEREAGLAALEEELDARGTQANERDIQLDKRDAALDKREESLKQEQESAEAPAYKRVLTEQELADLQSLSRSFSNMDPEIAAGILEELYEIDDVAAIIYHMSERNAAGILSVMDADFAARITEILLKASG